MNELTKHYRLLLGLDESWLVDSVEFSPEDKKVAIRLSHSGGPHVCTECGGACAQSDLAPERSWRHLDTMQFQTIIHARVPRSKCKVCGVKTIRIPWADKHSRFTLLFEAFAIEVLQASANVQRGAELLGLTWKTTHTIMERAVQRGISSRSVDEVKYVGMDEKNFGSGQSYVSVLTDISGHRVLEVTEDRTQVAADSLWESLPESQREQVLGVSMDMWQAYISSARKYAPQAEIVHDKFHVSKDLNDAVDKVRRAENKSLRQEGDDRLVGTRQLFLKGMAKLSKENRKELNALKNSTLKTGRAWSIKEHFRRFWDYTYTCSAETFFHDWYAWAIRSRLKPIKKVARKLKRHLPELLSYFRQPITNAMSEGFNSRIQSIKSNARGFHAFENYRTRILFYCGKLDLKPDLASH